VSVQLIQALVGNVYATSQLHLTAASAVYLAAKIGEGSQDLDCVSCNRYWWVNQRTSMICVVKKCGICITETISRIYAVVIYNVVTASRLRST